MRLLLALLLSVLAACNGSTADNGAAKPAADAGETATPPGAEAYAQYCASCHTDGVNGAPRLGVPEDWEGRSQLWQAVLFAHAESGYLSMPARGGAAEAADRAVKAAAEYLMETTFRDRPVD